MAKRGPKPRKPGTLKIKKKPDANTPRTYKHEQSKMLLRPDVGLQPQFKPKKPPKTYRYDPGLDPALSWDVTADRERGEALIARIPDAASLLHPRAALNSSYPPVSQGPEAGQAASACAVWG